MSSTSESSGGNPDTWQDLNPEDDAEPLTFISLLDPSRTFTTLTETLAESSAAGLDVPATIRRLGLDFHGTVKLINYLRTQAKNGTPVKGADVKAEDFEGEEFLKMVVENDAVVFEMDEVLDAEPATAGDEAEVRAKAKALEEELEVVKTQFANYRLAVQETLDKRWGDEKEGRPSGSQSKKGDTSDSYFESYAYNDIHETMLKDAIRTDAYRDFIYGNKHIFKDKVVLDIGCGTGILSMFCAKAGAAKVIAVDKSDIITKAIENVFNNGLGDTITCLRGAIEDVVLPVSQVDIIVSEWMGYCLLYEAMLPSVLFARDKYLAPDGLLVPSSASLWVAPVADPEFVSDHITYWRDVYGFDMKAMQEGIYDEVRVEVMPKEAICGENHPFRVLDLHKVTTEDLVFKAPWTSKMTKDADELDGFTIWFDMFFAQSRDEPVPDADVTIDKFVKQKEGNVAFTTSAFGTPTHWKQGLMIAPSDGTSWKAGDAMSGEVEFSILEENKRALGVEISWAGEGKASRKVSWKLK